jgi:hypothetical protein
MLIKPEPARIEEVEPCHPNTDTQSNAIPVYEWITITAPENINDDDLSSTASQAWRDVLGALAARKGCAGLAKYQCHWGRVLENRCQMNILTFWVCKLLTRSTQTGPPIRCSTKSCNCCPRQKYINTKVLQFDSHWSSA